MKLSDFNAAYTEDCEEVKHEPFMQVDVDVLIDENTMSEENDILFDGADGHFEYDSDDSAEGPVKIPIFENFQENFKFSSILNRCCCLSHRNKRKKNTKRRKIRCLQRRKHPN